MDLRAAETLELEAEGAEDSRARGCLEING